MDGNSDAWRLAWGVAGPAFGALIGRLMHIGRNGEGLSFRRVALVELPTAIGTALLAWGIADYGELSVGASAALGVTFGYLGSRTIDVALALVIRKAEGPR